TGRRIYEAGNIETLVRVVDENGGFTIIPEMHLPMLSERQRENVRPLTGDCLSMRRVSIYIRHDYVREKMLNSLVAALVRVIPRRMTVPSILRGPVRL
ncbi:MAG: LysR family transcriptional regulator, partial [Duncaniella sp.]|nr:LysR family transcriptional regulator [Duncaniella sp.]